MSEVEEYIYVFPFDSMDREKQIDGNICVVKNMYGSQLKNFCGYMAIKIEKIEPTLLKKLILFYRYELTTYPQITYCELSRTNEYAIIGWDSSQTPSMLRCVQSFEDAMKLTKELRDSLFP